MAQAIDLPLITEATNEYYRALYADPYLAPVFKGVNMVVLRTHVSYFIHQLTMFDTPMSERQLEYLRKVHLPVIEKHNVTQRHYDLMVHYLLAAMRTNGAEEDHLVLVQAKLQPLRDLFPPHSESVDGQVVLHNSNSSGHQLEGPKGASEQQHPGKAKKKFKAWVKKVATTFSKH